jgi:hypothetical protein
VHLEAEHTDSNAERDSALRPCESSFETLKKSSIRFSTPSNTCSVSASADELWPQIEGKPELISNDMGDMETPVSGSTPLTSTRLDARNVNATRPARNKRRISISVDKALGELIWDLVEIFPKYL